MRILTPNALSIITAGLMAAAVVTTPGCTPVASYPTPEGSFVVGTPATEPIPTVLATAIAFASEWNTRGEPLRINLPPGSPPEAYDAVIRKLKGGQPMREPGEIAYHVQSVRVRPFVAEVDMIHPKVTGGYETSTYYLRRDMLHDWEITGTRAWRLPVVLPEPNYVPPAPKGKDAPSSAAGDEAAAR